MREWFIKLLGGHLVTELRVTREDLTATLLRDEIEYLREQFSKERERNDNLQQVILRYQGIIRQADDSPRESHEPIRTRNTWRETKARLEKEHARPVESIETEERWREMSRAETKVE